MLVLCIMLEDRSYSRCFVLEILVLSFMLGIAVDPEAELYAG